MINRVVLIGRMVRDPELRTTSTGKSVCSFSIAVDKKNKPNDGSSTADFFTVQAWEKSAEFVCEYLGKGRLVAVDGRLASRKYTASDGTQRETMEIVAEDIQSLERPRDGDPKPTQSGSKQSHVPVDDYDPFADE